MPEVYLSIVLPCFGPAPDWQEQVIRGYGEIAAATGLRPELIIADDGNEPAIRPVADLLMSAIPEARILRHTPNRGKGYALRQGVAAAQGAVIMYTDIDFPYTTQSFLRLFDRLRSGEQDVAIGIKDEGYYQSTPRARRVISKSLRRMIRLFLRMPVTDTQCGLKGFTRKAAPVFQATTIDRYLFDLEFVYQAYRAGAGLRVAALPVSLRPNVVFRKMNYRILFPELRNFMSVWFKTKGR